MKDSRTSRLVALFAMFAAVLLIYLGVLYDTQVVHYEEYLAQSLHSIAEVEEIEASRGIVTDRKGRPLVSNTSVYTLHFDTDLLDEEENPNEAILRLLTLCPEVLDQVRSGALSAGHARALVSLKTEKLQKEAAQKIVALGLSVRQAELMCKNLQKEPTPAKPVTLQVNYISECEKSLSKQLGRGVRIVDGKRKGRFELEFYGPEDLQNLLDALMKIKK